GISIKKFELTNVLKISSVFALFQGLMPLIGWFLGLGFRQYIDAYDHWVAFGILVILGGKMISDGFKKNEESTFSFNPIKMKILLALALATSIDAMAVGLSFAMLEVDIIMPVIIIGGITHVISALGFFLGIKIGNKTKIRTEIPGGLVLIGIGVKILIESI
ncbi:MAG TPA: hypothetical protein DCQ31_01155, partial [Bacteroidales bacterium]|nr:hypothetical protein [Bacteroidales bacterium]